MPEIEITNEPCSDGVAIVIFGVTGDLARRKLMPALYENAKNGRLPAPFYILGFARRPWSHEKMREVLREGVEEYGRTKPVDTDILDALLENAFYIESTFEDIDGYRKLDDALTRLGVQNTLFYLSTPPGNYSAIVRNIGQSRLESCSLGWRRIVVEKPFGRDLETALSLDAELHAVFHEDQIYRMDHYLGKETVQNIHAFRFGNGIFEPLWNRKYIDHIEITMAENDGVGTRAGYYDHAGVIRDVFQNHLLQLLTLWRLKGRKHCKIPSGRSMCPVRSMDSAFPVTGTNPESNPIPPRKPIWLPGCLSITGGGRESRSICGPAKDCPAGSPRSPSNSRRFPWPCLGSATWQVKPPTFWSCKSNLTRGSRCTWVPKRRAV